MSSGRAHGLPALREKGVVTVTAQGSCMAGMHAMIAYPTQPTLYWHLCSLESEIFELPANDDEDSTP